MADVATDRAARDAFLDRLKRNFQTISNLLKPFGLPARPTPEEMREKQNRMILAVAARVPQIIRGRRVPLTPPFDVFDPREYEDD